MRHAPDRELCRSGRNPLANSYVDPANAGTPDPVYPLHARVCGECLLVQVEDVVPAEHIFSDYAYFSSYSKSWVEHARNYADMVIERFGLDQSSSVIEVASNDGYLLQHFAARDIPVLGVEPAANVARAAEAKGIATRTAFSGPSLPGHCAKKEFRQICSRATTCSRMSRT